MVFSVLFFAYGLIFFILLGDEVSTSIHIQILQTKRHVISNLPGERQSTK